MATQKNRLPKKNEYLVFDLTAAALGLVLAGLFALTVRNGVGMPDEAFYYTIAHRLMHGEKMIADEWSLSQFVYLFNVLPAFLYIKLRGGTQGIILFMRCLFIAIDAAYYTWMYAKLRRFRGWGIAAAFLFCAVIQQSMLALAYFTVASMASVAVCILLAADERPSTRRKLVLTGAVMACGILAEPFLIAGFALWFAFTVLREIAKRRGKPFLESFAFILERRVFVYITLGAAAVFAVLMSFFTATGAFGGLSQALPYLFSGAEYNAGNLIDFSKFAEAVRLYGAVSVAGMALCSAAAAVFRLKKGSSPKVKRCILAAGMLLLAGSYVYAAARVFGGKDVMLRVAFAQYNSFMLLLFSPTPLLLRDESRPRLTVIWAAALVYSALVDLSSTVILASGGGLLRLFCILQLSVLLREPDLRPGKTEIKKKAVKSAAGKRFSACAAVFCAAAVAWDLCYFMCSTFCKPVEKLFLFESGPLSAEIEEGPFRGLVTTPAIREIYENTLADLDEVKALADGAPVTVLDLAPYMYLYLDLPYGAFSAWYEFDEPERLAAYWQLRPAQRPKVIYVPFYDKYLFTPYSEETLDRKLAGLAPYVETQRVTARAGYILLVKQQGPDA